MSLKTFKTFQNVQLIPGILSGFFRIFFRILFRIIQGIRQTLLVQS